MSPPDNVAGLPPHASFPCPRCGDPVRERRVWTYSVFPCDACGGVWIDNALCQRLVRTYEPNAILAAEEASRFAVRAVDTRPAVACPACGATLLRVAVNVEKGIEIDACVQHGTWFDRDELPRVARAFTQPPEPIVLRTAPNTLAENAANAGRTALDHLIDFIANIKVSLREGDWGSNDQGGGGDDSTWNRGSFDGTWGIGNDDSGGSDGTGGGGNDDGGGHHHH